MFGTLQTPAGTLWIPKGIRAGIQKIRKKSYDRIQVSPARGVAHNQFEKPFSKLKGQFIKLRFSV